MVKMNMIAALNSALEHQLERDENVVIFGEDVGYFGGVFRVTAGLQTKFGAHRVFDSPLAEGGIAAIAMGMGNVHQLRKNAFVKVAGLVQVVAKHYALRTVTTTVNADQLMVLKT